MAESGLIWLDDLIFSVMLCTSLGIGVYHAFTGGKQRTTSEYILGNRSMSMIPVAISLMVTKASALTLLGFPAEVYAYGSQWFVSLPAYMLGAIATVFLFMPVFYPLPITSINEVSVCEMTLGPYVCVYIRNCPSVSEGRGWLYISQIPAYGTKFLGFLFNIDLKYVHKPIMLKLISVCNRNSKSTWPS